MKSKILITGLTIFLLISMLFTPIRAWETITFSEEFDGNNIPLNPSDWEILQDDPISNISIKNDKLFTIGSNFTEQDYDIIKFHRDIQNTDLFNVEFNYSRIVNLSTNSNITFTIVQVILNETTNLTITERGETRNSEFINNNLTITVKVNSQETIYIANHPFRFYNNCLNNTVIRFYFVELSNVTVWSFYYLNSSSYLGGIPPLILPFNPFNTSFHYLTEPLTDYCPKLIISTSLSYNNTPITLFDDLEIRYTQKILEEPEDHRLLIIIFAFVIAIGLLAIKIPKPK